MRPYTFGRNKRLHEWRRSGPLGKTLIYLRPFFNDLALLWNLGFPCSTGFKILMTSIVSILLITPIFVLIPMAVAAHYVALRLVTTDPDTWGWDTFDVFGLWRYRLTSIEEHLCRKYLRQWYMLVSTVVTSIDYYRLYREVSMLDATALIPDDIPDVFV